VDQSLYRISDVMQCPLHYKDGNITGHAVFKYKPLPGLEFDIPIIAKKVTCTEQTSVLFKTAGHLWMLVGYYEPTRALTLFMIDATKIDTDGVMIPPDRIISKINTLKETVDLLRAGIVQSFLWKSTYWEPFKLPKS
jgi:hypothetical protein